MSLQHFSSAQIKRISSRDEYSSGTYRAKVVSADKLEGDTAPEGILLKLAMLTDPDDVESAHRMTTMVRLPLGETETSGPIATFQLRQAAEFGTVLFDDLEGIPTWNRDTKQVEVFGQPVAKEEADALTQSSIEAALNRLVDTYEADEIGTLVGKCFYVTMERSKSKKDGKVYVNARSPMRDLPEGTELVDAANFVHVEADVPADEDAEEEKAPAPKKTPAKKATPSRRR